MIRSADLAKIHIAKKQLGMDDATYRAMLAAHGGVASAKNLTHDGAARVLAHLQRCGFKPAKATNAGRPRPRVGGDRKAQVRKIEALLADAGRPWSYADALVKKLFATTDKVERVEFCNGVQLAKVIAALAIDATRRAAKAAGAITE
ncbi:gp16 family protein [Pseudoduganella sp. RAF19]|uniref:gp16 family protein n=1 Tax=Pseudoduganella sp. RAF19 TaxID=3233052 RepID=UPI003F9CCB62